MKWFRSRRAVGVAAAAGFAIAATLLVLRPAPVRAKGTGVFAHGSLTEWLKNAVGGSGVEAALFRRMSLPTGEVLYPRSPSETRPAITALLKEDGQGALYSLRALQDEQALDFTAAEADWKAWVEHAPDRGAAGLDLVNFYARRLRPSEEVDALIVVAQEPALPGEALTAANRQRSWKAFARILTVIQNNALGAEAADRVWTAWMARYPDEPAVDSRYFDELISEARYDDAAALIGQYSRAFPKDAVFPIEARATLAFHRGSAANGLAIYDKAFDPLWPPELIQGYFNLLKQTHSLSAFVDRLRARLSANPDDLDTSARLFYAYQQQGRLDEAKQVFATMRRNREERGEPWKARELFTLAKLLEGVRAYPEAARYYYALYSAHDAAMADAQEQALSGLIGILLDAPEQPVRLGAGNLSMYRDIGTMDDGPGYLNGILSLLLNTTDPRGEYATEDQLATPYFHRAEAARLLAMLDARFPQAPQRAGLHAKLIAAYGIYGEDEAVIRAGGEFLAQFPKAPRRIDVALRMADACARTHQTQHEFAIYDQLLRELSAEAGGVPLGDGTSQYSKAVGGAKAGAGAHVSVSPGQQEVSSGDMESAGPHVRSAQYQQVLDRYLARLVAMQDLPRALAVLRGEVERDPEDPGIYEKLAEFLNQNRLGEHEEEVYRRAIQQFDTTGWYAKLARFYLRRKRNADYSVLTAQVTKIFSGTELESYLAEAHALGGQLSLEVNLYAHQRFPHDLVFTENLLSLYSTGPTANAAAREKLLAENWFESASLRNAFFEQLAEAGQLDAMLAALKAQNDEIARSDWAGLAARNPAAAEFLAESDVWQSHFEEAAAPAGALAGACPANAQLGEQAASLDRSLAYFDPAQTDRAVAVEQRLLEYAPGDLDRLARIGDIYADRGRFADAAPYWLRMAEAHPGEANGYLQSATVFWDYFDFDHALAQLEKARVKLKNPTLYSYEEGAIYEGKRDYAKAIAEYARGAAADAQSRERLLTLARRPEYAALADAAVAPIAQKAQPSQEEISLLADVYGAQKRKADLASALKGMLQRTASFDTMEAIGRIAAAQSLVEVRQRSLEREIAITTDPVQQMELRYDLAHFYESSGNAAAADSTMDALYREHPKILGVVRATVDYDWAHERRQQAVDVLREAASAAYPSLARQFNFEAARKLTEMGQYAQARPLLAALLTASPFDGEYLEAMAETYSRAGDNAGLRDFYQTEIAAMKEAPAAERTAKIAMLRRGLIPALTLLKDAAAATQQYIELISAYPDDDGLAREAALYAARYRQQDTLLDFYGKTVARSPRDSRWMIVLARVETALEDDPAAIDAYSRAIVIRPDRVDLYTARAALNEKLQHYGASVEDYEKLYTLTYKDPQWMEKAAETRARQGKPELAVAALKAALIDGRPAKAANYFDVARRLEGWNMLAPASAFAQKGVELAGNDLLADGANQAGAATYARIMTRLRKADVAYATLESALTAAGKAPGLDATVDRVEAQGIATVTDTQWREQRRQVRLNNERQGFAAALREMASTARQYYTPEERQSFAELLGAKAANADSDDRRDFYIPAATAGGLSALQAELEWKNVTADPLQSSGSLNDWIRLERSRLLLDSAAKRVEEFAPLVAATSRNGVLEQAVDLYRDAGDEGGELRALESIGGLTQTNTTLRARYFALLLAREPQRLVALAGAGSGGARDAAAQYAVLHGPAALALEAVKARSRGLDPVWLPSYTGLTGLYRHQFGDATGSAFLSTLGDQTIGERIAKPVDRTQQLAGGVWFYYGARYGEYLGLTGSADAEDFLPAMLEENPQSAGAYEELAAWYGAHKDATRGIAEYDLALQLTPGDAAVYDKIAMLLWNENKKDEAIEKWKTAVSLLAKQVDLRRVPDSFWPDFAAVCGHLGERGQFAAVRAPVDAMLRDYIRKNGSFMVEPLLRAAYAADGNAADATTWVLELAAAGNPPSAVLNAVVNADWVPVAQRPKMDARLVELAGAGVESSEGEARDQARFLLRQTRLQWIDALMKAGDDAGAEAALKAVPDEDRKSHAEAWFPVQLELAARARGVAAMVDAWKKDPADAPSAELLRSAAARLDGASRDLVLGFVYESAIEVNDFSAANFLGLAEIRIRGGDVASAVALLRRMVLVSTDQYTDLDSAAALLVKAGHSAEAVPFLVELADGVPWNAEYRLRLDEARVAANEEKSAALADIAALAASQTAPYAVRAKAAEALAGNAPAANLGSEELNLLARGAINAGAARKPFFFRVRVAAAKAAPVAERIALLKQAVAIQPDGDSARIALARAAAAAKDAHLTINAAAPLLGGVPYFEVSSENLDEGRVESDAEAATWSAGLSAALQKLPRSARAGLLADVAHAYHRIGEDDAALERYRQAWHIDDAAARRKAIAGEIRELRREAARRATNTERAPTIHATPDQNHAVRPRLLASVEGGKS